ncbi:transposable element Tcb2 transposase [Trichonephila clavipes]|nr:transposable element Tcb2 transposase [Trichonephila clavipes]
MPGCRQRRHFQQTDDFTRGMVIGLRREGWSFHQIAADTNRDVSTVHRLWRRWLAQGNVARSRGRGVARVTSAREDRRMRRQAVAAPQATFTSILQHVQDTLDVPISTRTISRRLVESGLHSRRPLRTLALTPQRRRARLEWCRARATWMTEWWNVVFSDESRFCFFNYNQRIRVWRRRGERSNPAVTLEHPTARQCGFMGLPNAIFQQDNAHPHTDRISQHALRGVQMLPWPAYSPDLSPIEHVWDVIGRRLQTLPLPRTNDQLWQMVEREWRTIPQDTIRTLIDLDVFLRASRWFYILLSRCRAHCVT